MTIQQMCLKRVNWPLRGLYFLSQDLFDETIKEVAAPDAEELAQLRNQVEHRFLSLQDSQYGNSTATHKLMELGEFQTKTLRILKTAREAQIYLSLAMYIEESARQEDSAEDPVLQVLYQSQPIDGTRVSRYKPNS